MRMSGAFYGRSELTAPWGTSLHAMPGHLWFHAVTAGRCWLETERAEPRWLQPGDIALVPHGEGHVLRGEPDAPAPPILELGREQVSERYEILRHGGGGAATSMICAAVRFDHPAALTLIGLLPRMIHIERSSAPESDWMQRTLSLIAAEAGELRPGGETVITRLADVLVIQAIRAWIESDPAAQTGWLGALQDRQIGRAITLIHRDPARAWTVASLADELAMSRSSFAARFTELVDEPAMHYVARWRMNLALSALKARVEHAPNRLQAGPNDEPSAQNHAAGELSRPHEQPDGNPDQLTSDRHDLRANRVERRPGSPRAPENRLSQPHLVVLVGFMPLV